jgi:hypothetical protein
MRNSYLPYNPVFESLSLQASKYTSSPRFSIYERTDDKLNAEETQKYAITIISDTLYPNVTEFALAAPIGDMYDVILPLLSEKSDTLSKNAKLEDLVTSMYEIWEKCYKLASSHKRKDIIMPYYDKVNEGINHVMKAWAVLKDSAQELERPELINLVNSKMEENTKVLKKSIADVKARLGKK